MYKTILKNKEVIGSYNELVKLINNSGLIGNKILKYE
jgi:hypothetical protein